MVGPLRDFTIVTVRDIVSGEQVVLDGNHRLLAAMLLNENVKVTVLSLDGVGFPEHFDLTPLKSRTVDELLDQRRA